MKPAILNQSVRFIAADCEGYRKQCGIGDCSFGYHSRRGIVLRPITKEGKFALCTLGYAAALHTAW